VDGLGDDGFSDEAQHERHQGDAELGSTQGERQPFEQASRQPGPTTALFGTSLDATGIDGDQPELGRHEDGVGGNEQADGDEAECGFDRGAPGGLNGQRRG
jgi:hypothetical protein